MKTIILILKGFIIGLAKIIPGVSGAVLAISMNLYDKGIKAITEFFNDIKENAKFLSKIALGIIVAMVIGSKIVIYCLDKFYLITMLFFIGLIAGSIKLIYKKTNRSLTGIIVFTLSFLIMLLLGVTKVNNKYIITNTPIDYIMYFISGLVDAIGTVVPGVSSTALLMILGTYDIIIETISNIMNLNMLLENIEIISLYSIGMLLGLIIVSIIINICFKKYNDYTFSSILGIIVSSILLLILKLNITFTYLDIVLGLFMFLVGLIISLYFDK